MTYWRMFYNSNRAYVWWESLLILWWPYRLRFEVQQQSTGLWYSAEYWSFTIGDESNDQYRINTDGYSGDAEEGLHVTKNDGNTYHDGMMFTTNDHNNDLHAFNCAGIYGSGWWYNKCFFVNLNSPGTYRKWTPFSFGYRVLSASRMMIKPQQLV